MTDVSLPATGQTPPTVQPFLRVTIAGHVHDLTPAGARVLAAKLVDALESRLDTFFDALPGKIADAPAGFDLSAPDLSLPARSPADYIRDTVITPRDTSATTRAPQPASPPSAE